MPAHQTAADVKAAMGASQHVLKIRKMLHIYFSSFVCPDLAELVGVAGHLLEGLVVVLRPAVQVDALPTLAAVAVIRTVVHVPKINLNVIFRFVWFSEWLLLRWIV